jgi:hypothetical protein
MRSPRTQLAIIGVVGCGCALLGLFSWFAYGALATRAIYTVTSRQSEVARCMASYADEYQIAQVVLGVLSVFLGWIAIARGEPSA